MTDERCPHCDKYLEYVSPKNGGVYTRAILVEVRGLYDGGLYYLCPDCDGKWHRWTGNDDFSKRMRSKAEEYWKL